MTVVGPDFVPPAQYSAIWNVIAIAIVVGAILLIVVIIRLTRTPPATPEATDLQWMPAVDRDEVRSRYLAMIDAAQSEYRERRMPARQLHQRMSSLVREFAFDIDGVRARTMTLTDLRATRNDSLGDVIARLYPGEFAAVDRGNPEESVELARRVVRSWD